MTVAARLAGFAAAVAALSGTAALAGGLLEPSPAGGEPGAAGHAADSPGAAMTAPMEGAHAAGSMPVRGLAVAENGLRVVVDRPELRRGRTERLRFRVVDGAGRAVRDFDVEHTRRMHLIVARRDLTGFQHLHPVMDANGTWSAPLRLRDAGSYRMFADFSHDERPTTLAGDLRVDGRTDLRSLPAPAATAVSDGGYRVRLHDGGALRAGGESELRFAISRHGRPVAAQPYLGARGHLVALRDGDLAFLHVHPEGAGFRATFPTPGAYRLFLQFKVAGTVQTVAFTREVVQP